MSEWGNAEVDVTLSYGKSTEGVKQLIMEIRVPHDLMAPMVRLGDTEVYYEARVAKTELVTLTQSAPGRGTPKFTQHAKHSGKAFWMSRLAVKQETSKGSKSFSPLIGGGSYVPQTKRLIGRSFACPADIQRSGMAVRLDRQLTTDSAKGLVDTKTPGIRKRTRKGKPITIQSARDTILDWQNEDSLQMVEIQPLNGLTPIKGHLRRLVKIQLDTIEVE